MAESACRYCGHRIVLVGGTEWTHQPAGSSFQDGQHVYCYKTVAEPSRCTSDVTLRDEGHRLVRCVLVAGHAGDHTNNLDVIWTAGESQ